MSSPVQVQTLVDTLLLEQQQLTAVERFSQRHDESIVPPDPVYRDLIPLSQPADGEQYAFEVDLDACSGCKACVSACHSLNGLDEDESWRDVGALIGGSNGSSMQQTVTSSCHHCADPACSNGCPTMAYEKDARTGVVRHLDDQCIGCRYCELKCPYEVPKYNDRLGIVRKCDMCQGRLAEGEAPACVQACPNEAIRIRIVSTEQISARALPGQSLIAGTVSSDYTLPSTIYLNQRPSAAPSPADRDSLHPADGHFPLVVMLVLTQAGIGVLTADWLTRLNKAGSIYLLLIGAFLSFSGLAASSMHLGRPLQGWRAFLGWRTSWLSREIMVFGAWSGAIAALLASAIFNLPHALTLTVGLAATALGIAGLGCSVMVYADTRRPFWNTTLTLTRFTLTALAIGGLLSPVPWLGLIGLLGAVAIDAVIAGDLLPAFRKSGKIMRGPLRKTLLVRLGTAILTVFCIGFPIVATVLALASELAGRSLFFRAVDAPKMPGEICP